MGHSDQHKVELMITVADDSKASLPHIASELQRRGLDITSEPLETLGMISGMAEESTMDQLMSVDGVIAVEKAGGVQIAPPESDVQ